MKSFSKIKKKNQLSSTFFLIRKLSSICATILSLGLFAENLVVEYEGGYKIDWSSHVIRFYGEASKEQQKKLSLVDLEKKAISDALSKIKTQVLSLQQSYLVKDKVFAQSASALERSSYLTRSEFFLDPYSYRVTLQSALSNVFQVSKEETLLEKPFPLSTKLLELAEYTGLHIISEEKTTPSPFIQVINVHGKELFSLKDVGYVHYQKKLMGRWYVNPHPEEIRKGAGSKPYLLKVKPLKKGVFQVIEKQNVEKTRQELKNIVFTANIVIAISGLL